MIIAGYILIFAYVFFLILGVGNIVQKVSNVEMSRKIIHTGLFLLFIIIDIFCCVDTLLMIKVII